MDWPRVSEAVLSALDQEFGCVMCEEFGFDVSCMFFVLEFCSSSWICRISVFTEMGTFLASISSNNFSASPKLLCFRDCSPGHVRLPHALQHMTLLCVFSVRFVSGVSCGPSRGVGEGQP